MLLSPLDVRQSTVMFNQLWKCSSLYCERLYSSGLDFFLR